MNWYEKISIKIGAGTFIANQRRDNRIEVNVIIGLITLVFIPNNHNDSQYVNIYI